MSANERRQRNPRRDGNPAAPIAPDRIRIEPMSDEEFQASRNHTIPEHAADYVRRGIWAEGAALKTSREGFAQLLPQGLATRGKHFCNILDNKTGRRVGEVWYSVQEKGGKVQFSIGWIRIEPQNRRQGYASQTIRLLENKARGLGADRTWLNVWMDNLGAIALYQKLGYAASDLRMMKLLNPRPRRPPAARARKRTGI
jgi:ribosomal protein S18 acetylase RimI-like enzyme